MASLILSPSFFICLSFRVKVDLDIVRKARVVDDVSSNACVWPSIVYHYILTQIIQWIPSTRMQLWNCLTLENIWVILLACDIAEPVCLLVICFDLRLSCHLVQAQRIRPCGRIVFNEPSVFVNSGLIWGTSHPAASTSGWSGFLCCPLLTDWLRSVYSKVSWYQWIFAQSVAGLWVVRWK